jgi:hypothetical protein
MVIVSSVWYDLKIACKIFFDLASSRDINVSSERYSAQGLKTGEHPD